MEVRQQAKELVVDRFPSLKQVRTWDHVHCGLQSRFSRLPTSTPDFPGSWPSISWPGNFTICRETRMMFLFTVFQIMTVNL